MRATLLKRAAGEKWCLYWPDGGKFVRWDNLDFEWTWTPTASRAATWSGSRPTPEELWDHLKIDKLWTGSHHITRDLVEELAVVDADDPWLPMTVDGASRTIYSWITGFWMRHPEDPKQVERACGLIPHPQYPPKKLYRYCWLDAADVETIKKAHNVLVRTSMPDRTIQSWTTTPKMARDFAMNKSAPGGKVMVVVGATLGDEKLLDTKDYLKYLKTKPYDNRLLIREVARFFKNEREWIVKVGEVRAEYLSTAMYGSGPQSHDDWERVPHQRLKRLPKESKLVYHGGDLGSGRKPPVTYWTPDRDMAESYVGMTEDRFGPGGKVYEKDLELHPAPWETIREQALHLGYDPEDVDSYTPASVFDSEIHGGGLVEALIRRLRAKGYTGAVLTDVGYGTGKEGEAYVEFNR